jgi:hypothetical protein
MKQLLGDVERNSPFFDQAVSALKAYCADEPAPSVKAASDRVILRTDARPPWATQAVGDMMMSLIWTDDQLVPILQRVEAYLDRAAAIQSGGRLYYDPVLIAAFKKANHMPFNAFRYLADLSNDRRLTDTSRLIDEALWAFHQLGERARALRREDDGPGTGG